jgi:putative transposase
MAGIQYNESGEIQRYKCLDCGKLFTINTGFERMKHNPHAITAAMQLNIGGKSLRNTQKSLRLLGIDVCHNTISNWIGNYTEIIKEYVDNITPEVSQTW